MKVKTILLSALVSGMCLNPLSAQQNTIIINSVPAGAAVYWQGKRMGITPLAVNDKTTGAPGFFTKDRPAHDLYIHKVFFETEIETIKYSGASPMAVTVRLRPLPRLPFYDGFYVKNPRLKISNVVGKDLERLARLREEIYARYGRPIQDKRFTSYFNETRWYRVNPNYVESMLTPDDRFNLKRINDFLETNETDKALFNRIVRQCEYRTVDQKGYIRFTSATGCVVGTFDEYDRPDSEAVPYFFNAEEFLNFYVAGGKIYTVTSGKDRSDTYIHEVILEGKTLKRMKTIKNEWHDE